MGNDAQKDEATIVDKLLHGGAQWFQLASQQAEVRVDLADWGNAADAAILMQGQKKAIAFSVPARNNKIEGVQFLSKLEYAGVFARQLLEYIAKVEIKT